MSVRSLGLVANHHHERRIGRKTANFIGAVHAHLRGRGIQLNVEFVLDRPDEPTRRQIEQAARAIDGARIHVVDFGNLGSSRTHGVNAARADVICFVDGDDFFSMNWFEGALDYLSQGPRREVLHTRYMVGFDHEEFIRETMESSHPSFDPLSLAVDWYWSANLAIQAEVFAAAPIEPYDHAAGFGSEDWHWACNSLAAGIRRVSLPNTSYYYRVKPVRYALGKVADVIHMASPLFSRQALPPPPSAPTAGPIPVDDLTPEFYGQARDVEQFELGVSYLRSVEVGARTVRHFKPHTPPIVGSAMREVLASGFGDGSVIIFADMLRLTGGIETAAAMCEALTGPAGAPRLYIVDGDKGRGHARPDGYVLSLTELRDAGLFETHLERLIARYLIQSSNITVVNILSPRARSLALAYSRATRASVSGWINVVMEYGFDVLSQAYDELELFGAAGIESWNVALFRKTAREAQSTRGVHLQYDEALESDYFGRTLGSRLVAPRSVADLSGASSGRAVSPAASRAFRITADGLAESGGLESVTLVVNDELRALAEREQECILVSGEAFLGAAFGHGEAPRPPGLRAPSVTIVNEEGQPTYYVRHPVDLFNRMLESRRWPIDLAATGALGFDSHSVREILSRFPDRIPLAALIEESIRRAREAGRPCVDLFAANCIVSATVADLDLLDKAAIARSVDGRLAHGNGHG